MQPAADLNIQHYFDELENLHDEAANLIKRIKELGFDEVDNYLFNVRFSPDRQIKEILRRKMPSKYHLSYPLVCQLNEIDLLRVQYEDIIIRMQLDLPVNRQICLN